MFFRGERSSLHANTPKERVFYNFTPAFYTTKLILTFKYTMVNGEIKDSELNDT
jgi:hypothetical protein